MLFGVLEMPFNMAMSDELSRAQYWQRGQEAATKLRNLASQVEALQADAARYRKKREIDRKKMLQGIYTKDTDLIEMACIGFDASYDAALDAARDKS